MNTPKQLKSRFPYMFSGPDIGISISRGWMPIFEQLCEDIDRCLGADKMDFHFTQCKEKFGSARWYWAMKGNEPSIKIDIISDMGVVMALSRTQKSGNERFDLSRQIDALVQAATVKTQQACIVCGAPGAPDRHTGWVLLLCPLHAKQRQSGQLPNIWFEEENE